MKDDKTLLEVFIWGVIAVAIGLMIATYIWL